MAEGHPHRHQVDPGQCKVTKRRSRLRQLAVPDM